MRWIQAHKMVIAEVIWMCLTQETSILNIVPGIDQSYRLLAHRQAIKTETLNNCTYLTTSVTSLKQVYSDTFLFIRVPDPAKGKCQGQQGFHLTQM